MKSIYLYYIIISHHNSQEGGGSKRIRLAERFIFQRKKPISESVVVAAGRRGMNNVSIFERAKQQYRIINDEQWQAQIYCSTARAFGGKGWRYWGRDSRGLAKGLAAEG